MRFAACLIKISSLVIDDGVPPHVQDEVGEAESETAGDEPAVFSYNRPDVHIPNHSRNHRV